MTKTCKACGQNFTLEAEDFEFLKKFEVPSPTHCPDCRAQRRTAFRNDWNIYGRKCDLCGKNIISIFSQDKPFKVFCQDCYYGDKWDTLESGMDFDFSKTFFEQMNVLIKKTPFINTMISNSTNCDYNTNAVNSKDCYMSTRLGDAEGALYSYLPIKSLNCIDCYNVVSSQLAYQCIDSWNLYNCMYCVRSRNVSDASFCYECIGCQNCFGCVGLRNVEYYFFNQKCTKEEYEEKMKDIDLSTHEKLNSMFKKFFVEHLGKYPRRSNIIINGQNVGGDYIANAKDVRSSFDIDTCEGVAHSWGVEFSKDIYDGCFVYKAERAYEVVGDFGSMNVKFSVLPYTCHDADYTIFCSNNTSDCFGCVSLKQKQYCILNKLYSKDDYFVLRDKIVEHMKKTGEWGEFFPIAISPFAYNETVAQEYFPLTKDEVLSKGWKWRDPDPKNNASLSKEVIECSDCGKIFKLVPKEIAFYTEKNLPYPTKCHICRHKDRLKLRNPRKLWGRDCAKCNAPIETSYSPDRPEIVYCEVCYLASVY